LIQDDKEFPVDSELILRLHRKYTTMVESGNVPFGLCTAVPGNSNCAVGGVSLLPISSVEGPPTQSPVLPNVSNFGIFGSTFNVVEGDVNVNFTTPTSPGAYQALCSYTLY